MLLSHWARMGKVSSVFLGRACNDHCTFCPVDPEALGRVSEPLVEDQLRAASARGDQGVFLLGGEPTLHPGLLRMARSARRHGLALGLRTNARLFSLAGLASKLADRGLSYVEVGFYGDRDTHNRVTRDASFEEAVAGIDALRRAGVHVTLRCVLLRENLGVLGKVLAFARSRPGLRVAFVHPEARELDLAASAVPADPHAMAQAIKQALSESAQDALGVEIWGLPYCALGPGSPVIQEPFPGAIRNVKLPACASCDAYFSCPGISPGALALAPSFTPRPRPAPPREGSATFRGVPIAAAPPGTAPTVFRPPEVGRLDLSPRYPDTALVTLIVPGCELNCVFCETPQGDSPPQASSLEGVRASLRAMVGKSSGVYFTGGEPSHLPWLFEILGEARALGYRRIQLQSHAGRASDAAFAEALVQAGLSAIDVPIYGHRAEIHEQVTHTPGSFERTLAGMKNLQRLGVKVCLHATLFESNLGTIAELLTFFNQLAPDAAYLQTAGEVGKPGTYERIVPSPTRVGRAIDGALGLVEPSFPLFVTDVAQCHVQHAKVLNWKAPPQRDSECLVLPYSDWLMTFTAGQSRTHGTACASCEARPSCDGISREALAHFGEAELKPL